MLNKNKVNPNIKRMILFYATYDFSLFILIWLHFTGIKSIFWIDFDNRTLIPILWNSIGCLIGSLLAFLSLKSTWSYEAKKDVALIQFILQFFWGLLNTAYCFIFIGSILQKIFYMFPIFCFLSSFLAYRVYIYYTNLIKSKIIKEH